MLLSFISNIAFLIPGILCMWVKPVKKILALSIGILTLASSFFHANDSAGSVIANMNYDSRFLLDYYTACTVVYSAIVHVVNDDLILSSYILYNTSIIFIITRYSLHNWWDVDYYIGILAAVAFGLCNYNKSYYTFKLRHITSILFILIGLFILVYGKTEISHAIWHAMAGISLTLSII